MKQRATLICSTNVFENVYALFNIANGFASAGMDVTIFFTFRGLELLKKDAAGGPAFLKDGFFGPENVNRTQQMEKMKITSLKEQFNDVRELGVKFIACDLSMDMMGISPNNLIANVVVGGIGTYASEARASDVNLYI